MNGDKGFYLDFERPIVELEKKIAEMQNQADVDGIDLSQELRNLEEKVENQRQEIYANLTRWQCVQISRHPQRPYSLDYVEHMLTDFTELHGDRLFGDDPAVIGGPARLDGEQIVVVGIQNGRNIQERQHRNFGMPHPEGYRKALRLMNMAAKFRRPILALVDTSGAYPGIEAEERGQAEAIARNMFEMSHLPVPIIVAIIGQAFSGGAIGITVGDPGAHARARLLFSDCSGELFDHSLPHARSQGRGGGSAEVDSPGSEGKGDHRPHRAGALWRRPSRSHRNGGYTEEIYSGSVGRPAPHIARGSRQPAHREILSHGRMGRIGKGADPARTGAQFGSSYG